MRIVMLVVAIALIFTGLAVAQEVDKPTLTAKGGIVRLMNEGEYDAFYGIVFQELDYGIDFSAVHDGDEMLGVHGDINVPTPIENLRVGVGLLMGINRICKFDGEFVYGPTVSIKGKF